MRKKFLTNSNINYGASFNKKRKTIEFKLASYGAQNVVLCVFKNPMGDIPFFEIEMEKEENLFKVSVPIKKLLKKRNVFYYGYRIFGANFKKQQGYFAGSDIGFVSKLNEEGDRYNPNKLAYDPYSLELSHLHSSVSTNLEPFRSGEKNYLSDNSKIAPKSVFKIIKEQKIYKTTERSLKDEIIGEVHLKDLTRLLKMKEKGTYKGAAKFVKEIKKTGVTMVEFLPLQEFDSNIDNGNHWGYMPLNYFAIKKSYSTNKNPMEALYEFRNLINEFHKNDIKVCMDVVYNHTGEGRTFGDNEDAALFSYALIDNNSYYKLAQNAHYTNHSGCGNDLNTLNKTTENLILESLKFWINQGVDAFRFDLAVCLMDISRSGYAMYDKQGGILKNLKENLEKSGHKILEPDEKGDGVHLIAEPWMCSGANNYQLGNFPSYFAEWNDVTRDTIRAISIRPENVNPKAMRNVIEGQPNKFSGKLRSINYVCSHDGFSLFDMNNYDAPNPETKGGFRGEMCSSYKGDIKEQDNEIRKQILTLMVSYGVPMLQFGDIFLHTKEGNNNSYNLDNKINRINYKLDERKKDLSNYIKELIKFRKENKIFTDINYNKKISYYYPNGLNISEYDDSYWKNNRSNIICFKINGEEFNYYVAISKDKNPIKIILPKNVEDKKWHLIADTKENYINQKGKIFSGEYYELKPLTACIFMEKGVKKLWN